MQGIAIKHLEQVGGCGNVAFYYTGKLDGPWEGECMVYPDGSRGNNSMFMCGHCMQPMDLVEMISALQSMGIRHYWRIKNGHMQLMLGMINGG